MICTVALLCMLPLFFGPTGQSPRRPSPDEASCSAFWSVVNSPQTRAAGMARTEKVEGTNQIVLWWDDLLWAGAEYQQKEQIVNALGAEWQRCGGTLLYVRGLRGGAQLAKYSVWGVTIR